MNLAITGTPGCGKTTLANLLSEKFGLKVINEKNFALSKKIGFFNEDNELEIPIKDFEKEANIYLKNNSRTIFEGHLLCEMKLKVNKIIIITINPEILEQRLEQRQYSDIKIMDNVFCEGINYCKKKVVKNYANNKIIELKSQNTPKQTFLELIKLLDKLE